MPNWCSNSLTVSHKDPAMLAEFFEASQTDKLIEHYIPFPNGEWDYNWCVENWGTKWDVTDQFSELQSDSVCCGFMTAWSPPIRFFEKLVELGFEVEVYYHEPGMSYAGNFTNEGDEYHEYDFSDPDWREKINDEIIIDMLESDYQSYLEYLEEDVDEEEGE